MASTVVVNSEIIRDVIDCVFKKADDVETLFPLAFSSEHAFSSFSSALQNRLCVHLDLRNIRYELKNSSYHTAVLFPRNLADPDLNVLLFFSRFVDELNIFVCSSTVRNNNKVIEFLDSCKHCTVLEVADQLSRTKRLDCFQERLIAIAQSVTNLKTTELYLKKMHKKGITFSNLTELTLSVGNKLNFGCFYMHGLSNQKSLNFQDSSISADFIPNVETLCLKISCNFFMPKLNVFSRIRELQLVIISDIAWFKMDYFYKLLSTFHEFASLRKANVKFIFYQAFRDIKVCIKDVDEAFESAKCIVPVDIEMTQQFSFPYTIVSLLLVENTKTTNTLLCSESEFCHHFSPLVTDPFSVWLITFV